MYGNERIKNTILLFGLYIFLYYSYFKNIYILFNLCLLSHFIIFLLFNKNYYLILNSLNNKI